MEELARELEAAREHVLVGGRYTHYKHPDRPYRVASLGILEASEEVAVVYEAEYGERIAFVRPLASWLETVEHEGLRVPRFSPLPN